MEVLTAAARRGIRIIDMRHESGVTTRRRLGAESPQARALVGDGGPGHTNSLTGMAAANLAGSPLIAVSGCRPSTLAGRQAFQTSTGEHGAAVVEVGGGSARCGGDSVVSGAAYAVAMADGRGGASDDSGGSAGRQRWGDRFPDMATD